MAQHGQLRAQARPLSMQAALAALAQLIVGPRPVQPAARLASVLQMRFRWRRCQCLLERGAAYYVALVLLVSA